RYYHAVHKEVYKPHTIHPASLVSRLSGLTISNQLATYVFISDITPLLGDNETEPEFTPVDTIKTC
ncbi:MAG: hypothetical protein ACW963_08925, partial [Candidatus Sifarchaeia archaeon]